MSHKRKIFKDFLWTIINGLSKKIFNINFKASENEKRLQEDLVLGYNRLVRPVDKNTDQLELKLGIKLIQILDVVNKLKSIFSLKIHLLII